MDSEQTAIEERLTRLRQVVETHITLHKWILSHHLAPFDLILTGMAQRSICLVHGFASMVEERNGMCALGLVRMQIDTLMRLYGCTLVSDIRPVVPHILSGEPFFKLRSRDGKELRDSYLRQVTSEQFPWLDRAYKFTSEFIHFSGRHVQTTVQPSEANMLSMLLSRKPPKWEDRAILAAIDYFGMATDGILQICHEYMHEKHKYNDAVDRHFDEQDASEPSG